jgi:hypothetical protein
MTCGPSLRPCAIACEKQRAAPPTLTRAADAPI